MRRIVPLLLFLLAVAAPVHAQPAPVVNFGPCKLTSGSGTPETVITGRVCDLYVRTDTGGVYGKTSGTGNTGWTLLAAGGSGTVTSAGLSLPGIFSVSGSPVTTAGTLTATLATQIANVVFAGPTSGGAASPSFRQVVFGDWASNGCTVNQVPKWSGLAWGCADMTSALTVTGSPASGNLTKFSGSTSVTNGDLSGDVTTSGTLATTVANNAISNAKLATEAQATIKGRASGVGTGTVTDLTGTQATVILDAFVGDSGSGGTKGLVPAPATGDAAAGKFLKADGGFAVPAGTSTGTVTNTGTLTSGKVVVGNGGVDTKIGLAGANSILLGSGSSGSGAAYAEIALGTGLTISGTTISATTSAGNSTTTGTYASKPGSCTSGDLYMPTDSFYAVLRCNGSNTWIPAGYSDPASFSWSWSGTQGGATVDTTHGGIILSAPASTSRNYRGYVHTVPATPYYAAARIRALNKWNVNYIHVGIGFANSSTIGRETFGPFNNGDVNIRDRLLSDQTTYVSDPGSATSYYYNSAATGFSAAAQDVFLCISDDGTTNRQFWVSNDGYTWFSAVSEGRTTTFTPDRIGIFADAENATDSANISLLSWHESSSACSIN